MADPRRDPDSNDDISVAPNRGSTTSAPRRVVKALGVMVLVKVLGIIVVLALFRELQIQLGIGAALLVLLHVAAATALVAYKLRGGTRHGRRKQHEHRLRDPQIGRNRCDPAASGPPVNGGGHGQAHDNI